MLVTYLWEYRQWADKKQIIIIYYVKLCFRAKYKVSDILVDNVLSPCLNPTLSNVPYLPKPFYLSHILYHLNISQKCSLPTFICSNLDLSKLLKLLLLPHLILQTVFQIHTKKYQGWIPLIKSNNGSPLNFQQNMNFLS